MKNAHLLAITALSIGAAIGSHFSRPGPVSAAPSLSCRGTATAMARLELLFGNAREDGETIGDDDWSAFLDSEVTPRFPAGLTVLRGPGQWRGDNGRLVKEQANMLVVWYEPSTRTEADIEAIRSAYKVRFDQDSVMRVDSISCVSF